MKQRKRIPPGLTFKAAGRDPQVELDITNRGINDEAIQIICDALIDVVTNAAGTSKLEELKLKDNLLTAKSLRPLAHVVRATASQLRDLDLSNNAISITTDEDAEAWEEFLRAFSSCVVMRKLDLSGNSLGLKAFEVLQKVYLREDFLGDALSKSINLHGPVKESNIEVLTDGVKNAKLSDTSSGEDTLVETATTPSVSRNRKPSSASPDRPGAISPGLMEQYATTSGLRSIPFLPIFDCSLSDVCAMYLSYIVEHHALVAELIAKVPPAKPGVAVAQLAEYDLVEGCNGIIWKPNSQLGKDGIKVLELAEQSRLNVSAGSDEDLDAALAMSPMTLPLKTSDAPSPYTPLSQRQRRGSMSSGHGTPFPLTPGAMRLNSLDSTRNRLQADVIKKYGVSSNTLWHTSLRMLGLARWFLMTEAAQLPTIIEVPRAVVEEIDSSPAEELMSPDMLEPASPTPLRRLPENIPELPSPSPIEPLWPRIHSPVPEASPPPKQTLVFKLPNKHGQSNVDRENRLRVTVPENNSGPISEVESPKNVPSPRTSPKLPKTPYRSTLPKGLTAGVWGQILAYSVDAGDALSEAQMAQVVKYASNRSSLKDESSRLGKQDHAQIWKVLEQMGCLTYSS